MHIPIRLSTVADLLAREHTLGLYCQRCDRWAVAPLARLAHRGLGDRPIRRLRFRCVLCGSPATCQLRPPPLTASTARGWVPLDPATRAAVSD
jgi:hypothetical protein